MEYMGIYLITVSIFRTMTFTACQFDQPDMANEMVNIRSVVLLIIPVKRSTMHHWPRSLHLPSKLDLHPLHKVRRDLDMADVRWMPHRPYIVLLQYASSVEIVDESSVILERLVDVADLLHEQWALDVCITRSAEAAPQRLAR